VPPHPVSFFMSIPEKFPLVGHLAGGGELDIAKVFIDIFVKLSFRLTAGGKNKIAIFWFKILN
jgi:hypothetical protein